MTSLISWFASGPGSTAWCAPSASASSRRRSVGFDDDDEAGARGPHPLHGAEPDRPAALDDRDVAEAQRTGAHGVERNRRRLDLRRGLVGQAAVRPHDPIGSDRDLRREATVRRRHRVAPECRQERDLTARRLAPVARGAPPARRRSGNHHSIALGERRHLTADRRDDAGPLVAADRRVVRDDRSGTRGCRYRRSRSTRCRPRCLAALASGAGTP